jgi:hypothetical protein
VTKPAAVRSRGFFVSGGRLYDKFGNDFVFRGINNPHIWFDSGDAYLASNAPRHPPRCSCAGATRQS